MVNSDFPTLVEARNLQDLSKEAKLFFVMELGRRLYAGGMTELAEIEALSFSHEPADDDTIARLLAQIESRTSTTFASDYIEVLFLEYLLKNLQKLENAAIRYLGHQAQKSLNMISAVPAVSTMAGRSIELLRCTSVFEGPLSPVFEGEWQKTCEKLSAVLKDILANTRLVPEQIRSLCALKLNGSLTTVSILILSSLEAVSHVLQQALASTAKAVSVSVRPSEEYLVKRMKDFLSAHESLLLERNTQRSYLIWENARTFVLRQKYQDFALVVDEEMKSLQKVVDALYSIETKGVAQTSREQTLELECLMYVERLAAHLHSFGEPADQVEALKESLFKYALSAKIPCSEMLDEEVMKLSPHMRKESIVRARLEVRLNDFEYPLSVAHKDWVLKTVRSTLQ